MKDLFTDQDFIRFDFRYEITEIANKKAKEAFDQALARIAELEQREKVLMDTVQFYADRNNWNCFDTHTETKDVITVSDLSCKSLTDEKDFAICSGGRRAREALQKIKELEK
jgi:hypothetical protein